MLNNILTLSWPLKEEVILIFISFWILDRHMNVAFFLAVKEAQELP
jgi:membrane protein DedA with SNARE-associated domain